MTITKTHPFSEPAGGFAISPRMQALMTYAGQVDSYEKSSDVFKEMLQLEVSETQIYRVTDFYGKVVEATVNQDVVLSPVKEEGVLLCRSGWFADPDSRGRLERSQSGPSL